MMSLEHAGALCVKNTFFDEVSAFSSELEMRQCKSCFCRPSSDDDEDSDSGDVEELFTPSTSGDEAAASDMEEAVPLVCSLRTWSGAMWEAVCLKKATHRAAGDDWMQFMVSDSSSSSSTSSDLTASTELPGMPAGQVQLSSDDSEDEDEFPACRLRTLSWGSRTDGCHENFWKLQQGFETFQAAEPIEEVTSYVISAAAESVLGKVWELSQTAQGCREVQAALEEPGSLEARCAIVQELTTHVGEGLFCPYANFVLQKCIALLAEEELAFFFEELMAEGPEKASKHKFGCRVTQRLASKSPATWGVAIGEAILNDFQVVACHPYGNYVVQHLLENGADCTRASLATAVSESLSSLVSDTFGAAVVAGALKTALQADQVSLAQALVNDSDVLVALALSRHGHGSVLASLALVSGEESRAAILSLQQNSVAVSSTKFGRAVLAALEKRL